MSRIHTFLREQGFTLATNPCISPDFCLDWPGHRSRLHSLGPEWTIHQVSAFATQAGQWLLAEDHQGDCLWNFLPTDPAVPWQLEDGLRLVDGSHAYPCTWENLLRLKNLVLAHDPESTLFPSARGTLRHTSIGVGARFTTLHWRAVDWTMGQLHLSMTANQNSIPRELVYDVEAMLDGKLDTVPFPFIGASVPEGHQGQSVQGMSHGCVLEKLKNGFHRLRLPWGFNADHQPIGGKYDAREEALVAGSLLASYITFDLSPELSQTEIPATNAACAAWVTEYVPADEIHRLRDVLAEHSFPVNGDALTRLLCAVWPAMLKMKRRDDLYRAIRARTFTAGREYFRELSIDELPGLTTPETTAVMLALCQSMGMPVQFIAPAFGFQKNLPFGDREELQQRVARQWEVCERFGVSIGFHSGSGKSAENYRLLGAITGGRMEIKTSGRYTYEMGKALAESTQPADRALWRDWFDFTRDIARQGAFSKVAAERTSARQFILASLPGSREEELFADEETLRLALAKCPPDPDLPLWFEYNFLFVLAAGGRAEKAALGDHTAAGYSHRALFYGISEEARLRYAKNVATYLIFLAASAGLANRENCHQALVNLAGLRSLRHMICAG